MHPSIRRTLVQTVVGIVYGMAVFLTYGYCVAVRGTSHEVAAIAGAGWPFYWSARGVQGLGRVSVELFMDHDHMDPIR
ncbi:MAG: hypothetical protein KGN77_05265 [Xanthomonadaceae bacterium]|nr:hypothetical protein [Xanthomonadaceae bacterium]